VKIGRQEERIKKKLEKNPVQECNKIQKQFYLQLFQKFTETKKPIHQSYITYGDNNRIVRIFATSRKGESRYTI